jgi:signal transduction histidine kinase/putative methionine-R-sulfoxide reductase with GAF domain
MKPLFPRSSGAGESLHSPILRLCRVYCVLAAGAALFILICIYLNSWLWERIAFMQAELFRKGFSDSLYLNRYSFILNWLGLFMLAGAIFYGFKIARQASIDARRNAQFLQEAKQRTLEIAALYGIAQDVSAEHDLSALLQTILERAKTLLAAAGCAIFLYDPEHDDFQIAAEVGGGMPIGTHLPRHEGLAGRVAEILEPLIVNDYQNSAYRSKALRQLPITAAVCVPMVRGGELIGVLGVHEVSGNNRKFTEAEARLLSLFAGHAAGAVHNARLLDALRNSEERFRIAAGCASDIVYDWDLSADHVDYFGAVFDRTHAAGTPLARTRQEYRDLIHPEDRARVQAALDAHLETGKPFSEEYRISDEKGSYISVADRATAIRNRRGKPVRLIGAMSDITERKNAEQMKSDFVSFVTHQLRTPLSGVKWMLELAMESKEDPEEMQSFIEDARASTDRLIRLVNDLLDISRLEQGRLQVTRQHVDLAGITKEVTNEMTPLLLEKEQALSIEAADDLPQPNVDAQLIRQAILNLVSNASKYTPSGGKIRIEITRKADRIQWAVKDTGIGIPKADLGKLFGKFYRAGNALTVETQGTGLGLYLVRLIVERFGGNVRCESEEGIGSTFLFDLPLAV